MKLAACRFLYPSGDVLPRSLFLRFLRGICRSLSFWFGCLVGSFFYFSSSDVFLILSKLSMEGGLILGSGPCVRMDVVMK